MRKKSIRGVVSIALSLALMLGLMMGLRIESYADGEIDGGASGFAAPVIIEEDITEEELGKIIEEDQKDEAEENSNEMLRNYKATDNFWSQLSSPYYSYSFSKINANQKSFYNTLYNKYYGMIDGGNNLRDYETIGGKKVYYTPIAEFTGISKKEALNVAYLLMYDRPELYYINQVVKVYSVSGTNKMAIRFGVYSDFATRAQRVSAANNIKNKINWYLNQVSTSASAYDKEKKIHDLLIANCRYGNSNTPYNQGCASVFLNPGGETVCAGYSEAFALLCHARGIQAISITSTGHEWNMVNLGNYWYSVDVTWDDTNSTYNYFNKSESTMTRLDSVNHKIEGFWSSVGRPSCPYDYGKEPSPTPEPTPSVKGTTWYNGVNYSNVYDYNYYMNAYADLKAAYGSNPSGAIEHFVLCGMNEGRQAKSTFNVWSYRNRWSDLRQAFGWNNLPAYYRHYNDCGAGEGRAATGCNTVQNPLHNFLGVDCSPIYDYQYYINNNPDVKNAFGGDDTATFIHFLTCGMNEGRRSCENFNVYSYRNQWSDLRQAFGWNNLSEYYLHYLNCGRNEGRAGTGCNTLQNSVHVFLGTDFSAVYNYNYYVTKNPDVKRAFGGDDVATFIHFLTCGMKEGRQAKSTFNVHKYINNYADLRRVFGWNITDYYLHYINNGRFEGRRAS